MFTSFKSVKHSVPTSVFAKPCKGFVFLNTKPWHSMKRFLADCMDLGQTVIYSMISQVKTMIKWLGRCYVRSALHLLAFVYLFGNGDSRVRERPSVLHHFRCLKAFLPNSFYISSLLDIPLKSFLNNCHPCNGWINVHKRLCSFDSYVLWSLTYRNWFILLFLLIFCPGVGL